MSHVHVPNLAVVPFVCFRDTVTMSTLVPEWAMLSTTCERNGWHYSESTEEHTLTVIKNMRALLRRPDLQWLSERMSHEKVHGRTLLELFHWVNVLHDIAKPYTQEVRLDRAIDPVLYPGHEEAGATLVPLILNRLGFTGSQVVWVTYLVRFHGDMHGFFGKPADEFDVRLSAWEDQHRDWLPYLYLHAWADTIGAKLEESNPAQYDLQLARYYACLDRLR